MDETAESGVAAHWRYKENSQYDPKKEQVEIENQLHWFKDFVSITEQNEHNPDAAEYVESLSHDIFDANVYVFTPKGNVICLPSGSTPIDFAYRIHSDLGEHLSGARVNNTLVPISQTLKTGDIVEVITTKNASPNSEWLNIAKTAFAKSKIRKYLIKQNSDFMRDDAIKKGRQILTDSLRERRLAIDPLKLITPHVLSAFKCETANDIYVMLYGKTITPAQLVEESEAVNYSAKPSADDLAKAINQKTIKKNTSDVVVLENGDTVMINLANCCTPIPGDDIIGFVSTGQGVKIHRKDCPNVSRESAKSRLIGVKWNPDAPKGAEFPVDLAIQCHDRDGLLVDVLNSMANSAAKVYKVSAKFHPSNTTTTISMTIMVRDRESLGKYISILCTVKSVFQVDRVCH